MIYEYPAIIRVEGAYSELDARNARDRVLGLPPIRRHGPGRPGRAYVRLVDGFATKAYEEEDGCATP